MGPPSDRIDPTNSNATYTAVSVGYEPHTGGACVSVCSLQEHVTFAAYLYEPLGSGWLGGYVSIHPVINPRALLSEAQLRGEVALSAMQQVRRVTELPHRPFHDTN